MENVTDPDRPVHPRPPADLRLIAVTDLWITEWDVEDILEANDLADSGWVPEPQQTQETTAE